ncbi:TPA: transposase [Yersinia enterocolitica]
MTRQLYTPEFKRRAVALLLESGKSVARMAQELDIKENILYNWKKLYQNKSDTAFSNSPQFSEQELEIRRLKAKVELSNVVRLGQHASNAAKPKLPPHVTAL